MHEIVIVCIWWHNQNRHLNPKKNFSVILIPFVSELVILKGALIKYKTEMCTKLKLSLLACLSSRRQNNTFNDSQEQIRLLTPVYF